MANVPLGAGCPGRATCRKRPAARFRANVHRGVAETTGQFVVIANGYGPADAVAILEISPP